MKHTRQETSATVELIRTAMAGLVILSVTACGADDQANPTQSGDVEGSSLVFYSMPEGTDEPAIKPLEIVSIDCDTEQQRTRINLANDRHVTVEVDGRITSHPAWRITVDLEDLDHLDETHRDTISSREAGDNFVMHDDGSIQGAYPFQYFGDIAARYALEMDIGC